MTFSGDLDRGNSDRFIHSIQSLLTENSRELVLDFQQVDFIGSSALNVITAVSRNLSLRGRRLRVLNLSEKNRVLFYSLSLEKVVLIS